MKNKDVKWYEFWNPNSGAIGGLTFGFFLGVCAYLVFQYFGWI